MRKSKIKNAIPSERYSKKNGRASLAYPERISRMKELFTQKYGWLKTDWVDVAIIFFPVCLGLSMFCKCNTNSCDNSRIVNQCQDFGWLSQSTYSFALPSEWHSANFWLQSPLKCPLVMFPLLCILVFTNERVTSKWIAYTTRSCWWCRCVSLLMFTCWLCFNRLTFLLCTSNYPR